MIWFWVSVLLFQSLRAKANPKKDMYDMFFTTNSWIIVFCAFSKITHSSTARVKIKKHYVSHFKLKFYQILLRDTAGEVDASQVLRGGDGVPKHGTISWKELDDVGRQTTIPQDFVDCVAGRHGRVTGLPQNHITLKNTCNSVGSTLQLCTQVQFLEREMG